MPQYEYVCPEDGEVITLLRPMKDADAPVDDPDDRGRTFVRKHSTFMVGAAPAKRMAPPPGCCPCGDPNGPCNA